MKTTQTLYCGGVIALLCFMPISTPAQRGSASYINQVYGGQTALKEKRWNDAAYHFRYALQWNKKGLDAYVGLGEA